MGKSRKTPGGNLQNPLLEKLEDDANASFTCEICIEPVPVNKEFKNNNNCVHPFCLDCIAKYIQVKVEDHTASIPCPRLDCQEVLSPLRFRALIPPSVFTKWCDLLCDNYVLGFERIYCPNKKCRELVVNECGGTVKRSKCPNCKRLFCFQCKLGWHAGFGCEESRNIRERNDILFGQLAERNGWVRCPRCRHFVQLVEGCRVILCRCKTRFCYRCGGAYSASTNRCKCYQNGYEDCCYYLSLAAFLFVGIILLEIAVFTIKIQ